MIKANNWQDYFSNRIKIIRKNELSKFRFLRLLGAVNEFCQV